MMDTPYRMALPNLAPDLSLEGKVAVVTGARRGMGRTFALTFANAGADVAIFDLVAEGGEMEAVAGEVRALGTRCLTMQTDVTRKADVESMVQKTMDEYGAIDILVNNHVYESLGSFLDYSEAEWDKVIDVDLKGCFLCSQAVANRMVQRKRGSIINIGSVSGIVGTTNNPAYSVAKAGIMMLGRLMAKQLGPHNIRVNTVAPAWTKTDRMVSLFEDTEYMEGVIARHPLGRVAEREDIASAVLFLASDASSFITGQTLAVDGGMSASSG